MPTYSSAHCPCRGFLYSVGTQRVFCLNMKLASRKSLLVKGCALDMLGHHHRVETCIAAVRICAVFITSFDASFYKMSVSWS